nr:MAG: wsv390-like protein [Chiromantes dehaani nimavirus]
MKINTHVAHIYSLQDKRIIFDGFAVSPGEKSRLMRYDTNDRAFCLTVNPIVLEDETTAAASKRTARQIFENVRDNKKGMCAFSIMLTRAKARAQPPQGLLAETDGPRRTKKHYTNLVEGSKTNQRFTSVEMEYENAPVHIYNVVLFIDQPEMDGKEYFAAENLCSMCRERLI